MTPASSNRAIKTVRSAVNKIQTLKKAALIGVAGSGLAAGVAWQRHAAAQRNKNLSRLDRLKLLSRKIELGVFDPLKKTPDYSGPNGQFQGMKTTINPTGVAADAALAGGVGAAGYFGHKAVMGAYGQNPVLSDPSVSIGAGSGLNPSPLPASQAYSNLRNDIKAGATSAWKGESAIGSKLGPVGSTVSGGAGILAKLKGLFAGGSKLATAVA